MSPGVERPRPAEPGRPPSHCCRALVRGQGFGKPDCQPFISFPFSNSISLLFIQSTMLKVGAGVSARVFR